MASKNKTQETEVSVTAFLDSFVDKEAKRQDSETLIERMLEWTGSEARMWGPSIIGFGRYRYRYASGRSGEAPLIAFSPRKAEFSLYVIAPGHDFSALLARLGKYRIGKYCIYFKRLADLDMEVLEAICHQTIRHIHEEQQ